MQVALIAFVYGSPNSIKRRLFGEDLKETIPVNSIPWMAVGDFNAILLEREKKCSKVGKRCLFFGEFVETNDLYDLRYRGPSFTWKEEERWKDWIEH